MFRPYSLQVSRRSKSFLIAIVDLTGLPAWSSVDVRSVEWAAKLAIDSSASPRRPLQLLSGAVDNISGMDAI
jgi:hypothetical protein